MGVYCVFGLVNPPVFGLWPLWEGRQVSKEEEVVDRGGGGGGEVHGGGGRAGLRGPTIPN